MHKHSVIIELREGEVIPLDIHFDGDYFATSPRASVPVTVKKTCYLQVDDRGVRSRDDLQHFDEKPRVPGRLQLVGMAKGRWKRGTLRLTTDSR